MKYSKTVDTLLQLHDGVAALTASGVGVVGGSNKIIDLGSGRVNAIAQIDISAIDTVTGDELYNIFIEGSNSSSFASGVVPLANLNVGGATANQGTAAETAGRFELPFTNERNGVTYRYLRVNVIIAGTTPSLTFVAYVVKH